MRTIFLSSILLMTTACATTPVPNMRPMTAANVEKISSADIIVAENNQGVRATWFYKSTQGAASGFGLIGVAVAAVMDAIINAAPAARAQKVATQLSEVTVLDTLDASLVSQLNLAKSAHSAGEGLKFGNVTTVQKLTSPDTVNGVLEIDVHYDLAEDASALRVTANASYDNDTIEYQTPYAFEGSVPKSQVGGALYANSFTYDSEAFDVPALDDALKVVLVKAVENIYRQEDGTLPTEGDDFKKMQKGIEQANDDELTKSETSIFLIDNWTANNGQVLIREIKNAHSYIAKYVLSDMNTTLVPSMDGQDEIVETLADNRVVRRVGAGLDAGSYVSSPGNTTIFATFGNTVTVAKANKQAISAIKKGETN